MENFNWTQFTKRIAIKSDLMTIYNCWTKSDDLEKWFLSKAEFFNAANNKIPGTKNITVGNTYEWNWFAQGAHEQGKVLSANGSDFVEFTFAGDCIVQVELSKIGTEVLVELTHKEIPLTNEAKEHIRLGCAFGWTFYLINLKSILEGGIDLRNKNTEIVGVVNN